MTLGRYYGNKSNFLESWMSEWYYEETICVRVSCAEWAWYDAFAPRRIAATKTDDREFSDVFVSRDKMRITWAIKLIRG